MQSIKTWAAANPQRVESLPGIETDRHAAAIVAENAGLGRRIDDAGAPRVGGNPEDPNNGKSLCAKGQSGPTINDYPERLLFPLKRAGKRGEGKWTRITWDEASFKEFIKNPKAKVAGTKMIFQGLATEGDQDNVWAYISQFKADGTKYGKTATGTVWLDPKKTSPYRFYQFFVNADDSDVVKLLKMLTFLPQETIEDLTQKVASQPEQREAQKVLAREIVLEDLDVQKYDIYSHQNEHIVRLSPEQLKAKMAEKEAAARRNMCFPSCGTLTTVRRTCCPNCKAR